MSDERLSELKKQADQPSLAAKQAYINGLEFEYRALAERVRKAEAIVTKYDLMGMEHDEQEFQRRGKEIQDLQARVEELEKLAEQTDSLLNQHCDEYDTLKATLAACEQERERCAKVADRMRGECTYNDCEGEAARDMAKAVADAIRKETNAK